MTEQAEMLDKAVGRLFSHLMNGEMPRTDCGASLGELWAKVEELGIPNIFLPEEVGGFNGSWRDACVVFRRIGLHAVPAPIGETILARRWLLQADVQAPAGPITLGSCTDAVIAENAQGLFFSGVIAGAPWGAQVESILVAARTDAGEHWLLLPIDNSDDISQHETEGESAAASNSNANMAGEPRTTLHFRNTPILAAWRADNALRDLALAGALLRAGQMAGALEATLQLSIDYANERKQFGRSIGKFQAIQQQLAMLAEETAAIDCAAASAFRAVDSAVDGAASCATGANNSFADLSGADFEIAAAKLRANRAAAQATAIAHQVHGAIGFTHEHTLHRFTLRLLAWRGEFGNDRYWSSYLGRLVCDYKAANKNHSLWQQITSRGDRMIDTRGATL